MLRIAVVAGLAVAADARDMCLYLRCGGCDALAESMWSRLATLDSGGRKFQVSHRLGKTGKGVATTQYRTSELRTFEAVDNICEDVKKYKLAQDNRASGTPWHRWWTKGFEIKLGLKTPTSYGKEDKQFITDADKHLAWWCSGVIAEYEEEIADLVRATDADVREREKTEDGVPPATYRTETDFKDALCNKTLRVCRGKQFDAARAALEERWTKHQARLDAILKKKDEKKKLEEEKAAMKKELFDSIQAASEGMDLPSDSEAPSEASADGSASSDSSLQDSQPPSSDPLFDGPSGDTAADAAGAPTSEDEL